MDRHELRMDLNMMKLTIAAVSTAIVAIASLVGIVPSSADPKTEC